MECSVCKAEVKGRYCFSCGQQVTNQRVSIVGFINDFFSNIFSLESPLLKMIHALLTQPRFIVNNFIEGNKGYYFSPSKLLFYALLVIGIFLSLFPEPQRIFGLNFNVDGISPQLLFVLLLVPILSFFSYLTYFRRKRKFVEHLISIAYFLSLWTIILAFVEASFRLFNLLTVDFEMLMLLVLMLSIFYSNAIVFSKTRTVRIYMLNTLISLLVATGLFYSLVFILSLILPQFVHI